MTLRHLIIREILHRKLSFLLGLASVLVAVGCFTGALLALKGHDLRTERQMRKLEDDYRKITKQLGFNVLILHEKQDLGRLYAEGFASHYMPEDHVARLAASQIVTVNHLLPSLQQRITWPEKERTIFVIGTRGEVPILHRDPKKPLLELVEPGKAVVGFQLGSDLGLAPGSEFTLLGREFTVSKTHPERGTKDDITIWLNLAETQALLDKKGLINAILALECHCAGDRISKIREEITAILPDTKVIESASKAQARAEARDRAAEAARLTREEQQEFAGLLVPLVLLGCCFWIGFLALGNARERAPEVGILRTIGLRARDILWVFLGRAAVMGVAGAVLGYLGGIVVGSVWGNVPLSSEDGWELFDPLLLVGVLVLSPLLAVIATWVPALLAAQQDPAVVLRQD